MSENIPPLPDPGQQPPIPVPPPVNTKSEPPSKKVCAGIGLLLFVVTAPLSFLIPPACLVGLAVAIGSLFYKGYRFIFVGYALSLGLLLLGLIIYCSTQPFDMK